jgi:hypothetical protein
VRRSAARSTEPESECRREYVQPIVKVRAELFRVDQFGKVHVGGGHQPGIGVHRPRASQTFELPFLEHAQQLRLQFERRLADLVQKDGSAARQLESSDTLCNRARERPLLMAE